MGMSNNLIRAPLELFTAADVEPKEVTWLWYPYIPFGKVTLIQGDPGDGKSTFALNLAAILTRGDTLPFTGVSHEPMRVIYLNAEDDVRRMNVHVNVRIRCKHRLADLIVDHLGIPGIALVRTGRDDLETACKTGMRLAEIVDGSRKEFFRRHQILPDHRADRADPEDCLQFGFCLSPVEGFRSDRVDPSGVLADGKGSGNAL